MNLFWVSDLARIEFISALYRIADGLLADTATSEELNVIRIAL